MSLVEKNWSVDVRTALDLVREVAAKATRQIQRVGGALAEVVDIEVAFAPLNVDSMFIPRICLTNGPVVTCVRKK